MEKDVIDGIINQLHDGEGIHSLNLNDPRLDARIVAAMEVRGRSIKDSYHVIMRIEELQYYGIQ